MLASIRFRFLVAGLLALVSYYPGTRVAFAHQWILYEALRSTAAIIFAVLGAWVGLVYPDALEKLLARNDTAAGATRIDLSRRLIEGIFYSTAIVMIVLAVGVAREFARSGMYSLLIDHREIVRGLSFSALVALTLLELWALLLTLVPAADAHDALAFLKQKRERVARYTGTVRKMR